MTFRKCIENGEWDEFGTKVFGIASAVILVIMVAWVVWAVIDLGAALMGLLFIAGGAVLILLALFAGAGISEWITGMVRGY